jgi:hypothetical protein
MIENFKNKNKNKNEIDGRVKLRKKIKKSERVVTSTPYFDDKIYDSISLYKPKKSEEEKEDKFKRIEEKLFKKNK